jgi:hypothetical protein
VPAGAALRRRLSGLSGWTVLVLELPDGGVRIIGGALHQHEFFESVCHEQGS